jgi:diadenosine tetraphosphate (Ap4A) HIT family hydrolase
MSRLPAEIAARVALAQESKNPTVVARMPSGWAVLCDRQFPRGWSILLADPVVPSLNDLSDDRRREFLLDMARLGDAVKAATGAVRINYAIYGNQAPQLHAHVIPRHADEPPEMAVKPVWLYPTDRLDSRPFDATRDRPLMEAIAHELRS